MLLWEIVTWGETPYRNVPSLEALLELIKDGYRMSRPEHCPWRLWSIIKTCWMYQPEARPTWSHLISSLLQLYQDTQPGEYLELANHCLPTPPSSTENSGEQFQPAVPVRSCERTSERISERTSERGSERAHYKVLSSSVSGEYYRTLTSSPPTPACRLLSNTDSPHQDLLPDSRSVTVTYLLFSLHLIEISHIQWVAGWVVSNLSLVKLTRS